MEVCSWVVESFTVKLTSLSMPMSDRFPVSITCSFIAATSPPMNVNGIPKSSSKTPATDSGHRSMAVEAGASGPSWGSVSPSCK